MADQITLNIEGKKVKVDKGFLDLTPEQQTATVEEIAASMDISPKSPNIMPNVNRGIADSVGGLVDFINPFDGDEFGFSTGSARDGLTNVMERGGINVAQGEPETVAQGAARGFGQAAGALIPASAAARGLSTAGGMIGNLADDAYRGMTSVAGTAAETTAGAVSGAAAESAEQAGYPEWVQNTAAVAAPMALPAGAALAGAAGRASTNLPLINAGTKVARAIAREAAPYTKTGAQEVAGKRMVELAGGEARAEELAGRIGGENPLRLTPAQQTGDENMLALEQLAAGQDPNIRERLAAREGESRGAFAERVEQPGDIQDTRQFFETRRREFADDLRQRAEAAIDQTTRAIEGVGPQRTESENSLQVSNRINRALEEATMQERALWDAVPRDEPVPTGTARTRAQRLIEDTPRAQRNDIPRILTQMLGDGGEFADVETVAEMHGLYSELRRVARSAMAGNDQNKNMARIANETADAILKDLGAIDATTQVGRQINEARAFSAALHETFDRGAVGRLMKRTLDGDTAVDPELALKRTVGRGGAEAMVSARQVETAADGTQPFIADYLKQRFQDATITPTGEFSNRAAQKFLRDNRELFDRYPELRKDVTEAVQGREDADTFAARIEDRIKRLESTRLSAGAALIDGSPEKALRAFTEARNPSRAARLLANEARKDETGAALSGLKSLLSRELIAKSGNTGEGFAAAIDSPRLKSALKEIFKPAEISRMRKLARDLEKLDAAQAAAPSIGTSLSGASTNQLIETIARVKAAQIGGDLSSGGNMGGSLQTANIFSGRIRDVLGRLTADRASQMLADAVEDPELFRFLLSNPKTAKVDRKSRSLLLPYLIGTGAAAATDDEGPQ